MLVTCWYAQASKPPINAILHVHHVPNIPTNGWFFLLYFPKLPKPPKPMGFSFVPYSMIRRRYILLYPEKIKNTEVDTSNDLNLVFQTVSDSTLFWDKQQAVCGIRSGSMSVIRNVISAHKRYHLGVVRMQNLTIPLRPSTWKKAQGLCQDKALCRPCLLHFTAIKSRTKFRRIAEEQAVKEIQRRPRGVHSGLVLTWCWGITSRTSQHRQPNYSDFKATGKSFQHSDFFPSQVSGSMVKLGVKVLTRLQRLKLPSFVSQPPKVHPNLHAPRSLRASRLELFLFFHRTDHPAIQLVRHFGHFGHWLLALTGRH